MPHRVGSAIAHSFRQVYTGLGVAETVESVPLMVCILPSQLTHSGRRKSLEYEALAGDVYFYQGIRWGSMAVGRRILAHRRRVRVRERAQTRPCDFPL